jgi:hypothetical protein
MVGTDALHRGELVPVGGPDGVHAGEVLRQRPRGGGPDVSDGQCNQHPPQRLLPRPVEVVQQAPAVRAEHPLARPGLALGLLGRPGEHRHPQQPLLVELEDLALVLDHTGLQQSDGGLVAEHLDVERTPTGDVEHPLPQLGRAGSGVGAADVLVALTLGLQRGAALRALGRHHERRSEPSRSSTTGPDDLGDDVAGLAQHDGVTDQDALALDLRRVVQRRHLHGRP